MNTIINTLARFMISVFYMADGILLMNSFFHKDFISAPTLTLVFFVIGCIELSSGSFLFLGYKKSASAILLVICTLVITIFIHDGFFELLNNAALAAGLFLIINNKSGETFWEYAQTDINDLPDYKVKM